MLLLFRAQQSTVILVSYTFGLFLPFIREDLQISPLQAGLLQGVWWLTAALFSLPFGAWLSRFRPAPLVLVSLLLGLPFLFLQALAWSFWALLAGRLFFILCHVMTTPARALLLHQWAAPRHYALITSVGLSQHSVLLAAAVSLSPWLIEGLGSWRLAYMALGGLFAAQIVAWALTARPGRERPPQSPSDATAPSDGTDATPPPDETAPDASPLGALRKYPQGWLLAVVMLCLSATWTGMVTFLPTLWAEERGVALTLGGPLLGFLYYALIPSGFLGGVLAARLRNRKLLLAAAALLNVLFGAGITLSSYPPLLMLCITGLGLVWVATPAMQVLPFEFPRIRPREVAVLTALVVTLQGVGFAAGPVVVGLAAQLTGSIQTGLIALTLLTALGIAAGLLYPKGN